jgi:hypothetical protein
MTAYITNACLVKTVKRKRKSGKGANADCGYSASKFKKSATSSTGYEELRAICAFQARSTRYKKRAIKFIRLC